MRGSVKVIKFTALMSVLFLILTYFTTVNIETHIVELNTVWLSNNLALTVFGGAFASMLVVLICEVQKYITVKASMEAYIFYQAYYLYSALFLMQQNICDYQKKPENVVPENLFDETSRMIQSEIFALQSTDYAPFRKDNLLLTAHQKFCNETVKDFQRILSIIYAIRIAINKISIKYLEQYGINKSATALDEPLKTVLSIQYDRVTDALEKVDEYLKDIDKYCKHKHNLEGLKSQLHSNYKSVFEAWDFEKEFPQKQA